MEGNANAALDRKTPQHALESRLRQQSAVASLGQRALAPGAFDDLLWFAVSLVRDVLEIDHVAVARIEPGGEAFTLRASLGFPEAITELAIPLAGTQIGLCVSTRAPVLVSDLAQDDRFPGSKLLRELGLRSSLTAPIDDAEGAYGALAVQSPMPHRFTPDDSAFVQSVSAMLGQTRRRSAAEERLAYQAQLVAASIDPLIATDLEWKITAWNAAAEALYGWTAAEALGRQPSELLYAREPDSELVAARQGLDRDGRGVFVAEQRTKDGTTLLVEAHAQAITDLTGKRIGYLSVIRDVTQSKALERRLLETQKLEAVGRLAGGIAHDFNNILMAIRGYAFISGRKAGDAEAVRSYAGKITAAADDAAGIVRQLLSFSRRQPMQPIRLDVDAQLRASCPVLQRLAGKQVELILALGFGGAVTIDPALFDQAIENVVANAGEAMPSGGRLVIETRQGQLDDTPACTIRITDDGPGIDPASLDRVFDPFFSTKPQGSGLGLASAHGIVSQGGGRIEAHPAAGGGTEITISLPLAEGASLAASDDGDTGGAERYERVLLIEDEPIVRELEALVLRERGYDVVEAATGEEALAVEGRIDLVVSDIVLPGLSGTETVERLRETRPGLRVVFVSGYAEGSIVERGIVEPGVDFLVKPFGPDQLTDLIRVVLDRPADETPDRLRR